MAAAFLALLVHPIVSGAAIKRLSSKGAITVEVLALPGRADGKVRLSGPSGAWKLSRTKTLRGVPAGKYRVIARPVITDASTYYPTVTLCANLARCGPIRQGKPRLKPGDHLHLFVIYQTVVPKTTKALRRDTLSRLEADSTSHGNLVFVGKQQLPFAKDDVLVSPPSSKLPYGLMRNVKAVFRRANNWVVVTTPADLAEAIPRGVFDPGNLSPLGGRPNSAKTSGVGASFSFKFPASAINCKVGRTLDQSFVLDLDAPKLRPTAAWNGGNPMLGMALTLGATAKVSQGSASSVSCGAKAEFPKEPDPGQKWFTIRIPNPSPIPIWVTVRAVYFAEVNENYIGTGAWGAQSNFDLTTGFLYKDGELSHSFSATTNTASYLASPFSTGTAEGAIGVKLYFDLNDVRAVLCEFKRCGAAPTPWLSLGFGPRLKVAQPGPPNPGNEPWWRSDWQLKGGAGIGSSLFGFSIQKAISKNLMTRGIGAPPGRPREITAKPGDEKATVSWKPPPANPGPADEPCACKTVAGYTVYLDGKEWATVGSGVSSVTLKHLTNGRTYQVTITANSSQGVPFNSLQTEPVSVTPDEGTLEEKTLPPASAYVRYVQQLDAGVPVRPGSWRIDAGSLPVSAVGRWANSADDSVVEPVLTEEGLFTIKTDDVGEWSFVARAMGMDGESVKRRYRFTVVPSACAAFPCAFPSGKHTYTFVWTDNPCPCPGAWNLVYDLGGKLNGFPLYHEINHVDVYSNALDRFSVTINFDANFSNGIPPMQGVRLFYAQWDDPWEELKIGNWVLPFD